MGTRDSIRLRSPIRQEHQGLSGLSGIYPGCSENAVGYSRKMWGQGDRVAGCPTLWWLHNLMVILATGCLARTTSFLCTPIAVPPCHSVLSLGPASPIAHGYPLLHPTPLYPAPSNPFPWGSSMPGEATVPTSASCLALGSKKYLQVSGLSQEPCEPSFNPSLSSLCL